MKSMLSALVMAAAIVSMPALRLVCGQERLGGQTTVERLRFHHVHVNSVDPAKAAEYYPKAFALSATRTTFNGYEAVKTGKCLPVVHEGHHYSSERANRAANLDLAFRLEHAQLPTVQREVSRDGP